MLQVDEPSSTDIWAWAELISNGHCCSDVSIRSNAKGPRPTNPKVTLHVAQLFVCLASPFTFKATNSLSEIYS